MKREPKVTSYTAKAACMIMFLVFGFQLMQVSAQECDPTLRSSEKAGYQKRSNRCEGFYVVKVASVPLSLELRGFTRGVLRYDVENAGDQISVSCPFAVPSMPHVRASALPAKYYYRMDAELPSHGDLKWPVDEVLRPFRLDARRIRIFGWYFMNGQTIYFPINATSMKHGSSGDNGDRLTFQVSTNVDWLICRWVSREGKRDSVCTPSTTHYGSGDPIEIQLPSTLSGRIQMLVKALARDEGKPRWLSKDIFVDLGEK